MRLTQAGCVKRPEILIDGGEKNMAAFGGLHTKKKGVSRK